MDYEQAREYTLLKNSEIYRMSEEGENYNEDNKLIVKEISTILKKISDFNFSEKIEEAFSIQTLPCRFEKVDKIRLKNTRIKELILDMGHNSQSIEKVLERIKKEFKNKKIGVIYSGNITKDVKNCLEIMNKESDIVYLTFATSQETQ